MRKFTFSLEPVLNYRRIKEELLLAELAVLQAELQRQNAELSRLVAQRESGRTELAAKLSLADGDGIRAAYAYFLDRSREVLAQQAVVQRAIEAVEEKTRQVLAASTDRKALERLRDRKKSEYLRQVSLEEQKLLDEIASTRHARRSAESAAMDGRFQ
ncbi:MAG: flagellar export protein FliJ [Armatimonadota bacterium]